jgi:hypothetical protein
LLGWAGDGISLSVIFLSGCTPPRPDTRAADEAAIRKTDADWVKAAQSKQVDARMAFYSSDAVILPPNEKAANSPDSIRKSISALLAELCHGHSLTVVAQKRELILRTLLSRARQQAQSSG